MMSDPAEPTRGVSPVADVLNASIPAVADALARRDADAVARRVARQLAAGAAALDLNAWNPDPAREAADLCWLAATVRSLPGAAGLPLWIDTTNPAAAEAALAAAGRPAVLNGVSLQKARFAPMLRLALSARVPVVAQALTDRGPPKGTQRRVERARLLVEELLDAGLTCRDLIVDPCLLNIRVEPDSPEHLRRAVIRLRLSHPEARFTAGLRNHTWGLPRPEAVTLEARMLKTLFEVGLDWPLCDVARLRRGGR
jgi:5-methyltetrahydrofolate--homocysteine methyltransferase